MTLAHDLLREVGLQHNGKTYRRVYEHPYKKGQFVYGDGTPARNTKALAAKNSNQYKALIGTHQDPLLQGYHIVGATSDGTPVVTNGHHWYRHGAKRENLRAGEYVTLWNDMDPDQQHWLRHFFSSPSPSPSPMMMSPPSSYHYYPPPSPSPMMMSPPSSYHYYPPSPSPMMYSSHKRYPLELLFGEPSLPEINPRIVNQLVKKPRTTRTRVGHTWMYGPDDPVYEECVHDDDTKNKKCRYVDIEGNTVKNGNFKRT
jgi:hypothetical protein